ncbi:response regulator transcription factor [Gorillibacterium timonense]|uniref:response regulator transcription factor n=1 Tax=Gorillibacterium timonense TaxID=1689269 RepID=UPI00071C6020|nr:response regulator transcription factor [Gorillibacterium timonense]
MRILFIEDDKSLSATVAEQLQKEGYITDCCYDGEMALHYALHSCCSYDIILLDRMLTIIDGLTILKAMRQKHIYTPVLIMTGLGELDDKIDGLDGGADDYLVKPFQVKELLARIRALTRRPAEMVDKKLLMAYGLVLDTEHRRLTYADQSVMLTQKEADMMTVFMEQPDKTHNRSHLLWKVWGGGSDVEEGNIDNYIHFLRKRLRQIGCKASIKTIYGTGYQLGEHHDQ